MSAPPVDGGLDLAGLPTVDDGDQRGQEAKLAELDAIANGLCRAGRQVRVVHDIGQHQFRIVAQR